MYMQSGKSQSFQPRILDGFNSISQIARKENGVKQGPGTELFGPPYEGYTMTCFWKNDKKEGEATLLNSVGNAVMIGHFSNDELNGSVQLMDPNTNTILMSGNARNGSWHGIVREYSYDGRRNVTFDGEYNDGVKLDELTQFKRSIERQTNRIHELEQTVEKLQTEVSSKEKQLQLLTHSIQDSSHIIRDSYHQQSASLTIVQNSFNELEELMLYNYVDVQSISIGDSCFSRVKLFKLANLMNLHSLRVGIRSFCECTFDLSKQTCPWQDTQKNRILLEKKQCVLSDLPKMDTIDIGCQSFADFTCFTVQSCDNLKYLRVGGPINNDDIHGRSCNFYWIESFILSGLPSLSEVVISGNNSFRSASTCALMNCKSLTSIVVSGKGAFADTYMCCILNNPCLVNLEVISIHSAFYDTHSLVIMNCESLSSIRISGEAAFLETNFVYLSHLTKLTSIEISGKFALYAGKVSEGLLVMDELPHVSSVKFGSFTGNAAPFHQFKCIKRGINVSEVLYTSIRDHLKREGKFKSSIVEVH